jgi:hypothetical protein
MEGDTDERMATALELSDFVIIFISRDYKNRPNCRQEAQYAHQLKKKGKVQIIYVMMDPSYTTVSSPDCVDGWLGIQVGGALWYPLFNESQVPSTANEIVKIMGDRCKRSDNMTSLGPASIQVPPLAPTPSTSQGVSSNATVLTSSNEIMAPSSAQHVQHLELLVLEKDKMIAEKDRAFTSLLDALAEKDRMLAEKDRVFMQIVSDRNIEVSRIQQEMQTILQRLQSLEAARLEK